MNSRVLSALILGFLLLSGISAAQESRPPVIDMHLHAFFETSGDERYCFPQPCEGLPSEVLDSDQLRPQALSQMQEYA